MSATTLDVIDNYFARDADLDIMRVPGKRLYELGHEARRFAQASDLPRVGPGSVYLGGWPSANFWAVSGDLILSALLYVDSVIVKDPLSDWFSFSQYQVPHLLATRPGYLDPATHAPRTAETRAFLTAVIPAMQQLRPLVDSGAVVFTPSADFELTQADAVEEMTSNLVARLIADPEAYAAQFSADEITVEDNVRGLFVSAPGDQTASVHRALEHGMRHFSREYLLARTVGATYTAPFRHEHHLCKEGIQAVAGPAARVTEALMTTDLPILTGLTPSLVAKVRRDDSFEEFRARLHTIYADFPAGASQEEAARYLFDQERALLSAPLKIAKRAVSRGPIGRIGVSLSRGAFNIATGLAADLTLGTPALGVAVGAAKTAVEAITGNRTEGPQRVWNALVKHSQNVQQELVGVQPQPGVGTTQSGGSRPPYWGIPEQPGMSVTITKGLLITDFVPRQEAEAPQSAYQEGEYAPCTCGTGLAYRFCCKQVDTKF